MRKMLLGLCLMFSASAAFAACYGPYCYDDRGAVITAAPVLPAQTLAQIKLIQPWSTGQILYCSDCVSTPVCVSTGTATVYAFAGVSVTTGTTVGLGICK